MRCGLEKCRELEEAYLERRLLNVDAASRQTSAACVCLFLQLSIHALVQVPQLKKESSRGRNSQRPIKKNNGNMIEHIKLHYLSRQMMPNRHAELNRQRLIPRI